MDVLLEILKKESPSNLPLELKSASYHPRSVALNFKNNVLPKRVPKTLVDNNELFPRVILHYPGRGVYILSLECKEILQDDTSRCVVQQFIPYPFGPHLVRFRLSSSYSLHRNIPLRGTTLFAFLYGSDFHPLTMGICKFIAEKKEFYPLLVLKSREITHDLFWHHSFLISHQQVNTTTPSTSQSHDMERLVLITKKGLQLFQVEHQSKASLIQNVSEFIDIQGYWFDEVSCSVLFQVAYGIFQPLIFNVDTVCYQKIGVICLDIPKRCYYLSLSISLMTLYSTTYVFVIDRGNGVVYIFTFSEGKNIAVIDLKSPGHIELQRIDNFLLIHRPDRALSILYDLYDTVPNHKQQTFLTPLMYRLNSEDILYEAIDCLDTTEYPASWNFRSFHHMILNQENLSVYLIKLNLFLISRRLLMDYRASVEQVTRFLLRRKNAKSILCHILRWDFERFSGKKTFAQLVDSYQEAKYYLNVWNPRKPHLSATQTSDSIFIHHLSHHLFAENLKLNGLTQCLCLDYYIQCVQGCYLDESDITFSIILTSLLKTFKSQDEKELELLKQQKGYLPRLSLHPPESMSKCNQLLDGILRLCRGLLERGFLLHESLVCILLEVCIVLRKDLLIQQLFDFQIIQASPKILQRLLELWKNNKDDWLAKIIHDVALHLNDWMSLALLFLDLKQYHAVLCILRDHNVLDFPLSLLLRKVSEDIPSQLEDPDLFEEVLLFVRHWVILTVKKNEADPQSIPGSCLSFPKSHLLRCNVTNCVAWLPELIDRPLSVDDQVMLPDYPTLPND